LAWVGKAQRKGRDQKQSNSHQRKIRGTRLSSHVKRPIHRRVPAWHPCTTPAPQFKKHSMPPIQHSRATTGHPRASTSNPHPALPVESLISKVRRASSSRSPEEILSYLISQGQRPTTSLTSPGDPEDSVQVSSRLTQVSSMANDHAVDLYVRYWLL